MNETGITTTLKHALERTIRDYNEYLYEKKHLHNLTIHDYKNAFFQRMRTNLRTTNYIPYFNRLEMKNFGFTLDQGKIVSLSFKYDGYSPSDFQKFIDELNDLCREVDFLKLKDDISIYSLEVIFDTTVRTINNFKIQS
jgi:hypothetical protein